MKKYKSSICKNVLKLIVGWVERSETQLSLGNLGNVGFHSSTQPTDTLLRETKNY